MPGWVDCWEAASQPKSLRPGLRVLYAPAALLLFLVAPVALGFALEQAGSLALAVLAELLSGDFLVEPLDLGTRAPPESRAALLQADLLPLRTRGRHIVDRGGRRVRLRCVNWYGAHLPELVAGGLGRRTLKSMAFTISALGFNCVRLPYSTELQMASKGPLHQALWANPQLMNSTGLEVLDATIAALTHVQVMVVLNNHQGKAMWCCSESDGEGLWYTPEYPEDVWLQSLRSLARRYHRNPFVIGYDLRNEPRGVPVGDAAGGMLRPHWAAHGGRQDADWAAAAVRGGLAVSAEDSDALIVVEGLDFAQDLSALRRGDGAEAPAPRGQIHRHEALVGRVVYEVHDYCWYHPEFARAWQLCWLSLGWGCCIVVELLLRWRPSRHALAGFWPTGRLPVKTCIVLTILAASIGSWLTSYKRFAADLEHKWGFLLSGDEAPVWLGEFGTNGFWVTDNWWFEVGEVTWFRHLVRYIWENELDYAYWALNGDKSGEEETFGLLNLDYQSLRQPKLLQMLP